jgi:hypothetical protein
MLYLVARRQQDIQALSANQIARKGDPSIGADPDSEPVINRTRTARPGRPSHEPAE